MNSVGFIPPKFPLNSEDWLLKFVAVVIHGSAPCLERAVGYIYHYNGLVNQLTIDNEELVTTYSEAPVEFVKHMRNLARYDSHVLVVEVTPNEFCVVVDDA